MKAIMVMYDSLNRRMLSPYGGTAVPTPNFDRLAGRSVTFDCNYVGSMPCMPARREIHTGRYNFEHRSWGPMEPYDDSMPEILKKHGIYTHLSTDHYHYWQDGGATYHSRYASYDLSRGQEGDTWKVTPELVRAVHADKGAVSNRTYDAANRSYIDREERMPQNVTFQAGLDFIRTCHEEDGWFLQIEAFDPHEPFFTQPKRKIPFADSIKEELGDWPPYYFVTEGEDAVRHFRAEYAALITMCDDNLGKVLDLMDEYDLWKDTLLIVNTDHGYLLGEHGWWSKNIMPLYDEISHTPLFIHDPRCPEADGSRRSCLTQTIDLAPTLLEYFGAEVPKDMEGKPLGEAIAANTPVHDYVLFGYHDGYCNVTDGRYVYMKAPADESVLYEYTLMPTHMDRFFSTEELQDIRLQEPFSFTKGCRTMKIPARVPMNSPANFGTLLFDLKEDPGQKHPLADPEKETELTNAMLRLMHADDAPKEWYERFGLPSEGTVTPEDVRRYREAEEKDRIPAVLETYAWDRGAANMYRVLSRFLDEKALGQVDSVLSETAAGRTIDVQAMVDVIHRAVSPEEQPRILYFAMLSSRTE